MKSYTVDQIRALFLDFFRSKDHRVLPSASLIPHGDPTLLLTVAGMVPFKRYFLGLEKPIHSRVATSQKCIRTGDIENVGKTDRHGTFFEMLGNFSFADYFKAEIIPWSWEFVTEHLRLPADSLWISIYVDDDEAFDIWHSVVGVPAQRIVRLGKEDNFWETGSGPCGPCSEIYIDRGLDFGCGQENCQPGCDCDRFLEFWNLVFIQFQQNGDEYTPLEEKGIDTGMGLERVAALLQGKASIFGIDNFQPIIDEVGKIASAVYGQNPRMDVSLRVIADHVRAFTFLIGDGVLPTNEGRGYVLRRLIRRAIRHGRLLDINEPFLNQIVDQVINQMGQAYPELAEREQYIKRVVQSEEERFNETLEQGMRLLQNLSFKAKENNRTEVAGRDVFQLYDTFGFPLDLTKEILHEQGLTVDEIGFEQAMEAQRERARHSRANQGYLDSSLEAYKNLAGVVASQFVGYEQSEISARVVGLIVDGHVVDQVQVGQKASVILDKTVFYPAGGGQTADQGTLITSRARMSVKDVQQPVEGLISHFGVIEKGQILMGDCVTVQIDRQLRLQTARHHTATHLLHWALRDILGEHVNQAGSYVGPERLRFDFTHNQAVSEDELVRIEDAVNLAVLQNLPVQAGITDLETAKKQGAMALFGEKYEERVRVIKVGEHSLELCGGTHVDSTGEIGLFKIITEGSVAAGVRRVEAIAGLEAMSHVRIQDKIIKELQAKLPGNFEEMPAQIGRLLLENRELEKELSALKQSTALSTLDSVLSSREQIDQVSLVVAEVEAEDAETLRVLGDRLRDRIDPVAILLGARSKDRVLLLGMVSKSLVRQGVHAGQIVKAAAEICGGGGGGRPDMAQAGGRLPAKLPEALEQGKQMFRKQLGGIP